MFDRFKVISSAHSNNSQFEDIVFATIRLIFSIGFNGGKSIPVLEEQLAGLVNRKYAVVFNLGRSALFSILKCLNLRKGDEVLLQGYTNVSVPNSIIWNKLKPVYVDIGDDLNMDPKDLEKKITKKSKALIIQHTFGLPAKLDQLLKIAKLHNLIVIEDCAHALGVTYKSKPVGSFGMAGMISIGTSKIIDAAAGGIIVTDDDQLYQRLKTFRDKLNFPDPDWTRGQIKFVVVNFFIRHIYNFFGLGKNLYALLRKIGFISTMISAQERIAKKPKNIPRQMPEICAALALKQLPKLGMFNNYRFKIASLYNRELKKLKVELPKINVGRTYLRFTILVEGRDELIKKAEKENIVFRTWYMHVVEPLSIPLKEIYYREGSCPNAERAARLSLDLPIGPAVSINDAKIVCGFLLRSKIVV